jgi:hypothetical protein
MIADDEDKPYSLPPAVQVVEMLDARSWDDDVDDATRILLEMAADTVRALMTRTTRLALHLERAEAMR